MRQPYVLAAILLAVGASTAAEPVTVRSCDRNLTFDQPPLAAVSHDSNMTEMMLVLGLTDRMVGYTGISKWRKDAAGALEGLSDLPELSPGRPTKEVLISAGADFLFAGWNYGMSVGGEVTPLTLEPFGIQVYELTESCIHIGPRDKISMEAMFNDLLNLGTIFGVEERAEQLVAGYRAELADLAEDSADDRPPLSVFIYDSGEDTPFTAGRYAMPTALIEAAGGRNVMDDLEKSWATVGWEAVIDRDPKVIVIVNYGNVTADDKRRFLLANPALAQIDAVRNDRFVVLDYAEATPGPRNIDAIRKLVAGFRTESP